MWKLIAFTAMLLTSALIIQALASAGDERLIVTQKFADTPAHVFVEGVKPIAPSEYTIKDCREVVSDIWRCPPGDSALELVARPTARNNYRLTIKNLSNVLLLPEESKLFFEDSLLYLDISTPDAGKIAFEESCGAYRIQNPDDIKGRIELRHYDPDSSYAFEYLEDGVWKKPFNSGKTDAFIWAELLFIPEAIRLHPCDTKEFYTI